MGFFNCPSCLTFIQAMIKKSLPVVAILTVFTALLLLHCKKVTKTAETCSDGLLNQDEYWIDCGGPCKPCQTCSDGLQNQGETDIDCGGPNCSACKVTFPFTGNFGGNILRFDTLTIKSGTVPGTSNLYSYSMKADVAQGATLTIRIVSTGSDPCAFTVDGTSVVNWVKGMVATGLLEYSVTGMKSGDLRIVPCKSGSCRVEYYLNNSQTPYRTKTLSWK